MKESTKANVQSLLRWGTAAFLLIWLFRSGKLASLRDLERLFASPTLFTFACLGIATNYLLNFIRWKFLLSGVGIRLSFKQVLRLSMIGQFFSIFMPGSVGGDVIKAIYVAKSFPQHRTDGIASILLDRILGFLTLMGFASFFFVLSFDASHLPNSLKSFGSILTAGTIGLFLIVLLPGRAAKLLNKIHAKNSLIQRVEKTLKAFARNPLHILKGLMVSVVSQGAAILGMYWIGLAVYGPLPWGNLDAFKFISATAVGTTASALPLSPMGLGIGQVAFGKVFVLLGAPAEAYGIVIISAVQIIAFVINLSGAIWFLNSKKEIAMS